MAATRWVRGVRIAGPIHAGQRAIIEQTAFIFQYVARVRQEAVDKESPADALASGSGHVGLTYEDPETYREALVQFLRMSIAQRRLTVFAHAMPSDEEAMEYLHGKHLDKDHLRRTSFFLLTRYNQLVPTRRGRINHDSVSKTLDELAQLAQSLGRRGVRIWCDAPRAKMTRGETNSWLSFEEWWNRSAPRSVRLVCAYPRPVLDGHNRRTRIVKAHTDWREPLVPFAAPLPYAGEAAASRNRSSTSSRSVGK